MILADASRHLGRNEPYLHQFLFRGSPKRLAEEIRGPLASLLGVPEGSLRSGPLPPTPHPDIRLGLVAMPTQDIPVFTENDVIEPALATEWMGRPPLLGATGPLFALWISAPHGQRLRPGNLAISRMNQPARPGELVVVLSGKRVIAVGELIDATAGAITVADGAERVRVTEPGCRVLKIGCPVMP
jgi:hypothetical protein